MTTSASATKCSPPPAQTPLTATMVGSHTSFCSAVIRWISAILFEVCSRNPPRSPTRCRSMPTQKPPTGAGHDRRRRDQRWARTTLPDARQLGVHVVVQGIETIRDGCSVMVATRSRTSNRISSISVPLSPAR